MAKKAAACTVQCAPAIDRKREEEWEIRDDVDTVLRFESLATNPKRFNRAKTRLESAARRVARSSGRR